MRLNATLTVCTCAALLLVAAPSSAQDCNGDGLPDASQVGVQGLTAQYFGNPTFSGAPTAVRVDLSGAGTFNLDNWQLPAGIPEDQFSVRWTGGILFNQTNQFQFRVTADDGFRLYLDGVLLGASSGSASNVVVPATPITITQGVHHLRIELREDFGGQRLQLERKTAASPTWNVIPNQNFLAAVDANGNGAIDICESPDCNANDVPDQVDVAANPAIDCNANGVIDACESTAVDCDQNGLPDSCEAGLGGLLGRYYATSDFSGPIVTTRVDGAANGFNFTGDSWQPQGIGADDFSVRWTGALIAPTAGDYTLQVSSDDVNRIFVDGRLVGSGAFGSHTYGPIPLSAGQHHIRIDFIEYTGGAELILRWRTPGSTEFTVIPGSAFAVRLDTDGDGTSDICESGDCNQNLVPDPLEIAAGTAADCNGNGLLDSCDAAAGAPDCNSNGILDSCEGTVVGLYGRYFPRLGTSDPADPYRPGPLLARRLDPAVNFNDGSWMPTGVPESDFIAVWTGSITTPAESGVYRFQTNTDDGCRLTIDGTVVIERWLQNAGTGEGSIELAASTTYSFRFDYHEGLGEQRAILSWTLPSEGTKGAFTVVPSSAFRMATPDCNANAIPDDCDIANGTLPDPGAGIPSPCTPSACVSDLDGDNLTGSSDLAILLGNWGLAGGDLDGNGTTDSTDVALLLGNWGPCN